MKTAIIIFAVIGFAAAACLLTILVAIIKDKIEETISSMLIVKNSDWRKINARQ